MPEDPVHRIQGNIDRLGLSTEDASLVATYYPLEPETVSIRQEDTWCLLTVVYSVRLWNNQHRDGLIKPGGGSARTITASSRSILL